MRDSDAQFILQSVLKVMITTHRSSHRRGSIKNGVLKNFAKFKGKNLFKRLWHMCFPVNFAKFLRTPF